VIPIPRGAEPAEFLVGFLRELVIPDDGWVVDPNTAIAGK